MENLNISELRKKKKNIGIRVSDEERTAIDNYCRHEQISITDLFRIAVRKVMNDKKVK